MAERTKLTLDHLRKLAREHLGAGYSKLTRSELIDALRKAAPRALAQAEEPEAPSKAATPRRVTGRRVSMAEVETEIEELRSSTLKKKADAQPEKKGAKPVTARVTTKAARAEAPAEKPKALSRGVARVKSAIATIAKEVESRRQALKEEAAAAKPTRARPATPAPTPAAKKRKASEPEAAAEPPEAPKTKRRAAAAEEPEAPKTPRRRAAPAEVSPERAEAEAPAKATVPPQAPVEPPASGAAPTAMKATALPQAPVEPPASVVAPAAVKASVAPEPVATPPANVAPVKPAEAPVKAPRAASAASAPPAKAPDAPVKAPEAAALRAAAETVRPPDAAALHAVPETAAPPRLAARPREKVLARATLEAFPAVMAARMQVQRDAFSKLAANAGGTWSPEPQGPIRQPTRGDEAAAEIAPSRRARPPRSGEPITEGFFVARVAGRAEARLHHLTDDYRELGPYEGRPALLGSGGHRIYVLPRDPGSLFLYWDIRSAQLTPHEGERIVVRVMEGETRVRELDPASLSRGYYIDGLKPGGTYHVEAVGVSSTGYERDLDVTSSSVTLPSLGQQAERVRFLRVPFNTPLPRLREFLRGGATRLTEREGALRVTVPLGTWREEGITNWDPGLSGSGQGRRWVREGDVTGEQRVTEWEESTEGRALTGADRRGHELSGAGRPTSSFSVSSWGRGV